MRLKLSVAEFPKWVHFFTNYEHFESAIFAFRLLVTWEYLIGIRCEIARCDWVDGRPKQGHLQEAAREMRLHFFYIHLFESLHVKLAVSAIFLFIGIK